MRVAVLALVLAGRAVLADDRGAAPRVEVLVPVDPNEHHRLYWLGRKDHHLVPGTVTIDAAPYVCDVDAKVFADRDRFIAHIRAAHGTPAP